MIYVLIGIVVMFVLGVLPNLLVYGTDIDLWDNIVEVAVGTACILTLYCGVLYFIGWVVTKVAHVLF